MAQRVRKDDLVDGSVTTPKLGDLAVNINKLKTLDTGDATGVNAETLPFQPGFASPTIADKINTIISGIDWDKTIIDTDGSAFFDLGKELDLAAPSLVFFNGDMLNDTVDYELTDIGSETRISFLGWTPENGYKLVILAQLNT